MSEENLIQIKDIRKRTMLLEMIENTRTCCLVWSRTLQTEQFMSSKDPYSFVITKLGNDVILDILKDCKFKVSYRASVYSEVKDLYTTILLIFNDAFSIIPDQERNLLSMLSGCRCTEYFEEYTQGGVVIGGLSEVYMPERYFEIMEGGVVVGGSSEVYMPERYFEIMEGGVVVGGSSEIYVPERYFEIMEGGAVVGGSSENQLQIGSDTYIYIWFDNSGSMGTTLAPLQTMKNTLLKNALLPFYENDSSRYDSRVSVLQYPVERTLDVIHRTNYTSQPPYSFGNTDYDFPNDASNVVILWFQDEASSVYHLSPFAFDGTRTIAYGQDISFLRDRLNLFPENFFRAVFFQVQGYDAFPEFLRAVQHGSTPPLGFTPYPSYDPPFGLSDRDEFVYKYNIEDGGTPEYYLEEVLLALEELGFTVR